MNADDIRKAALARLAEIDKERDELRKMLGLHDFVGPTVNPPAAPLWNPRLFVATIQPTITPWVPNGIHDGPWYGSIRVTCADDIAPLATIMGVGANINGCNPTHFNAIDWRGFGAS